MYDYAEHKRPGEQRVSNRRAREDDSRRAPVQRVAATGTAPESWSHADNTKVNKTGLPDSLKRNIEHMGGEDLSDVRVHRNSPEPLKYGALAYTQGADIFLGPGQERHLPHETWHAMQQKQGRVPPTGVLRGVSLNDDKWLEREADTMGAKAVRARFDAPQVTRTDTQDGECSSSGRGGALHVQSPSSAAAVIQRLILPDSGEEVSENPFDYRDKDVFARYRMRGMGWAERRLTLWNHMLNVLSDKQDQARAAGRSNDFRELGRIISAQANRDMYEDLLDVKRWDILQVRRAAMYEDLLDVKQNAGVRVEKARPGDVLNLSTRASRGMIAISRMIGGITGEEEVQIMDIHGYNVRVIARNDKETPWRDQISLNNAGNNDEDEKESNDEDEKESNQLTSFAEISQRYRERYIKKELAQQMWKLMEKREDDEAGKRATQGAKMMSDPHDVSGVAQYGTNKAENMIIDEELLTTMGEKYTHRLDLSYRDAVAAIVAHVKEAHGMWYEKEECRDPQKPLVIWLNAPGHNLHAEQKLLVLVRLLLENDVPVKRIRIVGKKLPCVGCEDDITEQLQGALKSVAFLSDETPRYTKGGKRYEQYKHPNNWNKIDSVIESIKSGIGLRDDGADDAEFEDDKDEESGAGGQRELREIIDEKMAANRMHIRKIWGLEQEVEHMQGQIAKLSVRAARAPNYGPAGGRQLGLNDDPNLTGDAVEMKDAHDADGFDNDEELEHGGKNRTEGSWGTPVVEASSMAQNMAEDLHRVKQYVKYHKDDREPEEMAMFLGRGYTTAVLLGLLMWVKTGGCDDMLSEDKIKRLKACLRSQIKKKTQK